MDTVSLLEPEIRGVPNAVFDTRVKCDCSFYLNVTIVENQDTAVGYATHRYFGESVGRVNVDLP